MKTLLPILLLIYCADTYSDVTFDGSLNSIKAPAGLTIREPQIVINADAGKQVGSNLFHSFEQFNVGIGQTVTFSDSGKTSDISNIFNRVTGNELSRIDGKLDTPRNLHVNLYLFNPNGVIFGKQSKLALDSSLHVSTANFIRFKDNRVFDSEPLMNEVLTSAEPSAFGFLDKPADILVETASLTNKNSDPQLLLEKGNSLSFVGGDLTFTNPNIKIQNGSIRLISSKIAGEIAVSSSEPADILPENGGEIHMTNSTIATLSAPSNSLPSGSIIIQSGKLVMDSASITSSSKSGVHGGDIYISTGNMTLSKLPEYKGMLPELTYVSKILNDAYREGDAGNTFIHADTLTLKDAAVISAGTAKTSKGNGGSLIIESPVITLTDRSKISALSNTDSGDAGKIDIKTDSLTVKNSAISVETTQSNAGDIHINAKNLIYFLNGELTTSAASGEGNGGNIALNHPIFTILNDSKIIANASKGNGGNINIVSDYFLQSTDSLIKASSDFGLQGTISINSANSNIAGSITVLENRFIDSSNLMHEGCNRYRKNSSSFIVSSQSLVTINPDNVGNYLPISLQSTLSGC